MEVRVAHGVVARLLRRACGARIAVLLAAATCAGLVGLSNGTARATDFVVTYPDPTFDVVARPTDPGADGPFDPTAHRLVDLHELTLGTWAPGAPATDLFDGAFAVGGEFCRLDLVVDGLVNPPGSTYPTFTPFSYGDHPVYGFVEIDMDEDEHTGGELDAPQYRYLANIVRFGGLPSDGDFDDRVALDDSAFDGNFETAPYVERHGEEFHLALLGGEFSWGDVIEVSGDGDTVFDAGEVWHIRAAWFHRAHGFEPFSFMQGGAVAGEYAPVSDLQFRHDPTADLTTISLVFPLTNVGAGLMSGQPPEPLNFDPSDQASVLEGLADLVISAQFFPPPHQDPEEALIYEWYDENATDFLEPGDWRVTALLGSSYTAPDPAGVYFVWSDAYPDAIRGDVDGSGEISDDDKVALAGYIAAQDGSDGTVDGVVTLLDFAADFSVFDLNHDGLVDPVDLMLVSARGDCDDDGDVDLADYQKLQVCFTGDGGAFVPGPCSLADLDADNDVDRGDFEWFANVLTGAED